MEPLYSDALLARLVHVKTCHALKAKKKLKEQYYDFNRKQDALVTENGYSDE